MKTKSPEELIDPLIAKAFFSSRLFVTYAKAHWIKDHMKYYPEVKFHFP